VRRSFWIDTRCRRNEFQQKIGPRADDGKRKATDAAKRANYHGRFAVAIVDSIGIRKKNGIKLEMNERLRSEMNRPDKVVRASFFANRSEGAHDVIVASLAVNVELSVFSEKLQRHTFLVSIFWGCWLYIIKRT
jgi:hypothetical protein